jgi:hypothetical protein
MEEAKMLQSQHIINIWIELQCKNVGSWMWPFLPKKNVAKFWFCYWNQNVNQAQAIKMFSPCMNYRLALTLSLPPSYTYPPKFLIWNCIIASQSI